MFDIHQSILSSDGGEIDDNRLIKYIDGLMGEFAASPEAQPVAEQFGRLHWGAMMMDYAARYLGVSVPKMLPNDFREVVFELFPRKVSTESESASAIIAELKAFWQFVERQYGLANATKILGTFTDRTADELRKELANPKNYGMAKSFFMQGEEAGFDMTTQEGMTAFMLAYNSKILADRVAMPPREAVFPKLDDLPFYPRDEWAPDRKVKQEDRRKARKAQRQARKRNRR